MLGETKGPGIEDGEPQDLPISQEDAEKLVAKLEEKGEATIGKDRGRIGIILGKIYATHAVGNLMSAEVDRGEQRIEAELFENLYRGMPLAQALRYHPQNAELYAHHVRNSFARYQRYLTKDLTHQRELSDDDVSLLAGILTGSMPIPSEMSEAASKDRTIIEHEISNDISGYMENPAYRDKMGPLRQAKEKALQQARNTEEEVFGSEDNNDEISR